jgi:hypothetical protein
VGRPGHRERPHELDPADRDDQHDGDGRDAADLATFAAIEADANTAELTSGGNANYARKTISDSVGSLTVTIDNTNDRTDVDIADQTWTALGAGTAITDLVFGYDSDSTAGTDANVVPLSQHDFAVTPDGSDITATIAVFARAS